MFPLAVSIIIDMLNTSMTASILYDLLFNRVSKESYILIGSYMFSTLRSNVEHFKV